ncbi:hypothetical protein [Marinobacterium rhizophilum]|uniref:hypothetical protein n=1 Tax=Marinobacterium rhizophilum TaxID=420402 RepID=UPI000366D30C|nr:hypothetical protein [Marinobacterium rhizophilum]
MKLLHIVPAGFSPVDKQNLMMLHGDNYVADVEMTVEKDGSLYNVAVAEDGQIFIDGDNGHCAITADDAERLKMKANPFFELMNGTRDDLEAITESIYN